VSYYQILEVEQTATQEEIEKAYRKKALQYHPDRNPGDTEVHNKFIEIQNAYETLKDAGRRQQYDFSLRPNGFMPAFDFFEQENLDIKIIYKISILDSIQGANKTINISKKMPCDSCNGFGATNHKSCDACHGSGRIVNAMNTIFHFQTLCGKCLGQGKIALNRCEKCLGQKKVNTPESNIEFMIPKGIQNNMTLCINGQGNIGQGRVGDLYVQCTIEPDNVFKIDGLNLLCNVKTKFSTMLFGGKIEIPTPDNEIVELDLPPKADCLTKLRVKNKGMYDIRNTHVRGDIVATVIVDVPKDIKELEKIKSILINHGI